MHAGIVLDSSFPFTSKRVTHPEKSIDLREKGHCENPGSPDRVEILK